MDDTLKNVISNNSFINPYLRQFKKYLTNNKVKILGSNSIIDKSIKDNDLIIDNENYNGIVVYELNDEIINFLNNECVKNNNEIYVFIIDSNKEYDVNLINHLLKNNYDLVEEFIGDDKWKFILYKKNTTI